MSSILSALFGLGSNKKGQGVLKNTLFGSPSSIDQVSTQTPGQRDLLNFLIQRAQSGQGGFGFDEDFFDQSFTQPAINEFQNTTVPAIQQAAIASGQQRSSGLNDVLARAGTQLQGQLSGQRADLLNQALNRQLQAASTALGTQPFINQFNPASQGALPFIGQAAGQYFGGPIGGSIGSAIGQSASNAVNQGFRR